MFKILSKSVLADKIVQFEINAPDIAIHILFMLIIRVKPHAVIIQRTDGKVI